MLEEIQEIFKTFDAQINYGILTNKSRIYRELEHTFVTISLLALLAGVSGRDLCSSDGVAPPEIGQ